MDLIGQFPVSCANMLLESNTADACSKKIIDQNWKNLYKSRFHIGHLDSDGMYAACCTVSISQYWRNSIVSVKDNCSSMMARFIVLIIPCGS